MKRTWTEFMIAMKKIRKKKRRKPLRICFRGRCILIKLFVTEEAFTCVELQCGYWSCFNDDGFTCAVLKMYVPPRSFKKTQPDFEIVVWKEMNIGALVMSFPKHTVVPQLCSFCLFPRWLNELDSMTIEVVTYIKDLNSGRETSTKQTFLFVPQLPHHHHGRRQPALSFVLWEELI